MSSIWFYLYIRSDIVEGIYRETIYIVERSWVCVIYRKIIYCGERLACVIYRGTISEILYLGRSWCVLSEDILSILIDTTLVCEVLLKSHVEFD